MARQRNLNRDKAFELYKKNKGNVTPRVIAEELSESAANIRTWKSQDKWEEQLGIRKSGRGAPKNNKNALGNNGGAPGGNLNAFKHGERIPEERFASKKFLSKYLPRVTTKIMDEIVESGMDSLEILWTNIQIQFTAIIRSQKIMHVKSHNDITKEVKKNKSYVDKKMKTEEVEYEIQFAWDKQERFLIAQSKGIQILMNMIKTYEELLHKNWDSATEEQKLRVDKLKIEVDKLTNKDNMGPIKIEFIKASSKND
ncbi:MAG: phage terminase small subunit [Clostridium sp.]|uniref:phage terminase small subunit n=1 Tax=Clostridium sp. TaxID=1506 RepID=UPI00306E3C23